MDLSIILISVTFEVKNSIFIVHLPDKCKTKLCRNHKNADQ